MKILFGLIEPDESNNPDAGIFLNNQLVKFKSPLEAIQNGVGMVQQHFALAGPLSALDNIILGAEPTRTWSKLLIDRKEAEKIIDDLSGIILKAPWKESTESLSVGVQQKLEIIKLLFRKAEILIFDEPTAVLIPTEVAAFFDLLKLLKSQGKTIILITHKLSEILSVCDDVTVLKQGKVTATLPTHNLTAEELIYAMIGRDIQKISKEMSLPGEQLLEVKGLAVEESIRGGIKNLNFDIFKNEIVGIAGVEGNGQQALVEALLSLRDYKGIINYKKHVMPKNTSHIREVLNFGLISEDRHYQSLWLDASIAENTSIGFTNSQAHFGFINQTKMAEHTLKVLKGYDVKMSSVEQPIKDLSGGNQQKIVVAREMSGRKPEFLIASQPTRGVDVGAIEFIHQQILLLKKNGAGILLVSSELEELCALSDRILVLFEGQIKAEFSGPHFDLNQIGSAMIGAQ
jgi:ABC-type uncharacterized transport system ATPase subunit